MAHALAQEALKRGDHRLGFYVHKDKASLLDERFAVKTVGWLDRGVLYDRSIKLWHTSNQLSHYQPLNGKKVLTVHDLNFLYEPIGEKKKQKYRSDVNKNLRRCDAIIAISNFVKEDIKRYLEVGDIPIEVIYNGCNEYNGPITAPAQLSGREMLFAVGNVMPKKNLHVLPSLLVGNDYELVISGIIVDVMYQSRIIEEAKKYGVEDRVVITGPIDESVKHWYLKNCKALLHPSIAEGFGLPVIEAMSYGKPVFSSDHTSLREIGGNKVYYFNHDFDRDMMRDEFAAGLEDFAQGGKTPEDLIEYAHRFSWGEAARRHLDLYDRILMD